MNFSIHIAVPPATDVADLIGTYGQLLSAFSIENNLGEGSGEFSHPIEESREVLLQQIHTHYAQLEFYKNTYPNLKLVGQVIGQNMATLTFSTE